VNTMLIKQHGGKAIHDFYINDVLESQVIGSRMKTLAAPPKVAAILNAIPI